MFKNPKIQDYILPKKSGNPTFSIGGRAKFFRNSPISHRICFFRPGDLFPGQLPVTLLIGHVTRIFFSFFRFTILTSYRNYRTQSWTSIYYFDISIEFVNKKQDIKVETITSFDISALFCKGSRPATFCPYAIVYCYLEFKLRYKTWYFFYMH